MLDYAGWVPSLSHPISLLFLFTRDLQNGKFIYLMVKTVEAETSLEKALLSHSHGCKQPHNGHNGRSRIAEVLDYNSFKNSHETKSEDYDGWKTKKRKRKTENRASALICLRQPTDSWSNSEAFYRQPGLKGAKLNTIDLWMKDQLILATVTTHDVRLHEHLAFNYSVTVCQPGNLCVILFPKTL